MTYLRSSVLFVAALGFGLQMVAQEQPKRTIPGVFRGGNAPAQTGQPAANQTEQPVTSKPATAITGNLQFGGFTLQNASLTEVIDALARQLKINYILPKSFAGSVTLNTYGDLKQLDPRKLLDLILRINGYAMVKTGDVYQIVPTKDLSHQPLPPETTAKNIDDDDAPMLNLVFLKYITVDELANVLNKFIGEGGEIVTYPPANLMFVLDTHRNMRRLMELVSLFDDNALAKQRVHLYEVKNGRPSDLAKELTAVLKSISLNDKDAPIRFVPVDRINTLIAVAPNPGAFDTVGEWVAKLDVPSEPTAGATDNYVYRVKFSNAQCIAAAIYMLYSDPDASGYGGYGGYGGGAYGGTAVFNTPVTKTVHSETSGEGREISVAAIWPAGRMVADTEATAAGMEASDMAVAEPTGVDTAAMVDMAEDMGRPALMADMADTEMPMCRQ